ncbi:MAG: MSHA biogenesis protein MshK [Bacteroidota bacterium]
MKIALGLLVILSFGLSLAADGGLRDPTRPPDAAVAGEASGATALRLDAVLRPVSGRPAAVINGSTLRIGGEIQGKKLVAIHESSVILQGAEGREILSLAPEVEKTMKSTRTDRPGIKKKPGGGR